METVSAPKSSVERAVEEYLEYRRLVLLPKLRQLAAEILRDSLRESESPYDGQA